MSYENNLKNQKVEWKKVSLFLLLAFGFSWAIDLILYLTAGYGNNPATLILLQLQMLVPAASVIVLGLFVFKDGPLAWGANKGNARFFMLFYLALTLVYGVLGGLCLLRPEQGVQIQAVGSSLGILSVLVLIGLRGLGGKDSFAQTGLRGGKARHWLFYGLAFFVYISLMTVLNAIFKVGQVVDLQQAMGALGGANLKLSPGMFLLLGGFQTVLVGPFLGIVYGFGEEFGWRGFLQSQLTRLGKRRGILLLGLIWSVWHYPVIWMGHNYPGYPVQGTLLMTVFTTCLAFVLGYVMLKTGSIWLVAFLHAFTNQTMAFYQALVYAPSNPTLTFNAGLYGGIILVLVVALLLRDPIWRDQAPLESQGASGVLSENTGLV